MLQRPRLSTVWNMMVTEVSARDRPGSGWSAAHYSHACPSWRRPRRLVLLLLLLAKAREGGCRAAQGQVNWRNNIITVRGVLVYSGCLSSGQVGEGAV